MLDGFPYEQVKICGVRPLVMPVQERVMLFDTCKQKCLHCIWAASVPQCYLLLAKLSLCEAQVIACNLYIKKNLDIC